MGACCANDSDGAQELRTIEEKGLLVLEFGDSSAHWSDVYPGPEELLKIQADPSVKLKAVDSKHKSGYTPLSAIRLRFTNDEETDWFETELAKKGVDGGIDELCDDVDQTRAIREVAIRLTPGNAMCALKFSDEKGDDILDIEWENFDLCREWKAYQVPEGHELIGMQANCTNDPNNITRLAFVFRKVC